jgi:hypothetical protein
MSLPIKRSLENFHEMFGLVRFALIWNDDLRLIASTLRRELGNKEQIGYWKEKTSI